MGGENLASGVTDAGAVDMWYNEIQHTNGGLVSAFGMDTGHYTQVVWRETSRLGCGIQGTLLACQYGTGGNMAGGFESNVLAPSRTREECSAADEHRWSGEVFCTEQNTEFVCLATVFCLCHSARARHIDCRPLGGDPG